MERRQQCNEHLLRMEESRYLEAVLNYSPRMKRKREILEKSMKPNWQ